MLQRILGIDYNKGEKRLSILQEKEDNIRRSSKNLHNVAYSLRRRSRDSPSHLNGEIKKDKRMWVKWTREEEAYHRSL